MAPKLGPEEERSGDLLPVRIEHLTLPVMGQPPVGTRRGGPNMRVVIIKGVCEEACDVCRSRPVTSDYTHGVRHWDGLLSPLVDVSTQGRADGTRPHRQESGDIHGHSRIG